MGVSDLSSYGTGAGLKAWTLDDDISALEDEEADKFINRAHTLLTVYGPYDISKPGGSAILTDMVYYAAEAIYFWATNARAITSPFRAERIGSYSYDKGAASKDNVRDLIENHEIVWSLVIYLQDLKNVPLRIGTRIHQESRPNPVTGIRDLIITDHTNRIKRFVDRLGINSDTDEFNYVVYGDRATAWYF